MSTEINFIAHLNRQLGFLERSCFSYDDGCLDEAIRIATVIRVLVHNTKMSTSLLEHLNATTINLLSTSVEPPPQTFYFVGMGMMATVGGKGQYCPNLGGGPINYYSPVNEWWNQVVMVLDGKFRPTRKRVVLAAANKDGGAHVDSKLTPEYEALSKEGAVGSFVYKSQSEEVVQPFTDAHLVCVRQMGYELLHSPDLTALLKE